MGFLTDGLTFNVLREANLQRLPEFRNANGKAVHNTDGSGWSKNDWLTALAGELGEAANLLKKIRRKDFTLEEAKDDLADELADIQTYLDILAFRCGVNLGEATLKKFNRKSDEVGSKIKIRDDGSDWYINKESK